MSAPTQLEAIAWDIDGTLIDSEPLHLKALMVACEAHGVDISDLADDAFVGVSLHGVWEAIGGRYPLSLDREKWIAEINDHYRAHCRAITVDGSVRGLVEQLARSGLRQVAVSNSNRAVVDANLELLGIADLFELSLSFDDVATGKPDPEPYRAAAQTLGVAPRRMMVVEDSRAGIASARAAGCFAVGLCDDPGGLTDAHAVVASLDEIPALLARCRNDAQPVRDE